MALSDNPFIDLPLTTLQTMQAQWLQVLSDLAAGGKSYSFPGRSYTRADGPDVRKNLSLLRIAIRYVSGTGVQSAQAIIDTQSEYAGC
jgi:hypothetical protein